MVIQGAFCNGCGMTKLLVVDHIVPIALGGTDDDENLQALCFWCNARKGSRMDMEQLRASLKKRPHEYDFTLTKKLFGSHYAADRAGY